jgi:polysaccharide pyruvyl transferase WcaK-like protein
LVNQGRDVYVRVLSTDADYTSSYGVTGEKALVKSEWFQPWAWLRVLNIFARPDRVIVSGGTPFFDSSHAIRTLYMMLPLLFRVPVVVFGAGVKPLRTRYGRLSTAFFLRRARFVSVRDDDSREILQQLGVPAVELTADSAFFANASEGASLDDLLAASDIKHDESLLVVAPRLLSADRKRLYLEEEMGPDLIRDTPGKLAAAIDALAPRFGKVVLMAMHYHGPDSDRPIIRDIVRQVRASNVVFIDRELRPEAALALFRRAKLLLGVRLHALLLASSMGTPIVGIAYEQKVRSLFGRLGLDDYCLDLFRLDTPQLVAVADRALQHEQMLRRHLEQRVGELRALVMKSAEAALCLPPAPSQSRGDER